MSQLSHRTLAGLLGAVVLLVAGCAVTTAPLAEPQVAPASSAPASGFASPQNLLERYPEMRHQTI